MAPEHWDDKSWLSYQVRYGFTRACLLGSMFAAVNILFQDLSPEEWEDKSWATYEVHVHWDQCLLQ